jgi:hypothetical protein
MPFVYRWFGFVFVRSMSFKAGIELIVVGCRLAAIFGSAIGQHAHHSHALLLKARQYAIIAQVGRCHRRLAGVERGGCPRRLPGNKGLLVDAPDALERADVEGILTAQLIRVRRLNLAMSNMASCFFSSAATCDAVSTPPVWAT